MQELTKLGDADQAVVESKSKEFLGIVKVLIKHKIVHCSLFKPQ